MRCSLCGGEILDRSDSRYCVYCNSTFHRSCISEHFYRNKYCPVCNKTMSLIFMRYGSPPEPVVKKRPVPAEIRRPVWPHTAPRAEVPVFSVEIPTTPLKRTDKYIPRPRGKRGLPLPRKVPTRLVAVVLVLAVAVVAVYYSMGNIPFTFTFPGGEKESEPGPGPESPWQVVWTYPVEGISAMAASDKGIVVGSTSSLTLLAPDGSVLWQKEGVITGVDMKGDVIACCNGGVVEVYGMEGNELARYGESTCSTVSLSAYGILAVGLPEGKIVLLDMYGNILEEYATGAVGSVAISPDGALTAYRQGGTVYVLDILGEVKFAFEDGGAETSPVIVTASGLVFSQAGGKVFLYNGEAVVWSAEAGCENAGMAVLGDETQFAVNADKALLYSKEGQVLYELPVNGCGSIAFSGSDVVVSDQQNVYYLRFEQPAEEQGEDKEKETEETEEGEEEKQPELVSLDEWFTWYKTFLSSPNSCTYAVVVEEEGKTAQKMTVEYTIEVQKDIVETIVMIIQAGGNEVTTSFKRWISPEGTCTKAEMTIDSKVTPLKCEESTIRGIDLRGILSYQGQFKDLGTEEITTGKGTFTCQKVQIDTPSGVLTVWLSGTQPPVRITLEKGKVTVTMELQ